jgi:hypothetical protein
MNVFTRMTSLWLLSLIGVGHSAFATNNDWVVVKRPAFHKTVGYRPSEAAWNSVRQSYLLNEEEKKASYGEDIFTRMRMAVASGQPLYAPETRNLSEDQHVIKNCFLKMDKAGKPLQAEAWRSTWKFLLNLHYLTYNQAGEAMQIPCLVVAPDQGASSFHIAFSDANIKDMVEGRFVVTKSESGITGIVLPKTKKYLDSGEVVPMEVEERAQWLKDNWLKFMSK